MHYRVSQPRTTGKHLPWSGCPEPETFVNLSLLWTSEVRAKAFCCCFGRYMGCDHAASPSAWRRLSERHTWWSMELLLMAKVPITPGAVALGTGASRGRFWWQQWTPCSAFNCRKHSHARGFPMARMRIGVHGRTTWRHLCNSSGDSWRTGRVSMPCYLLLVFQVTNSPKLSWTLQTNVRSQSNEQSRVHGRTRDSPLFWLLPWFLT